MPVNKEERKSQTYFAPESITIVNGSLVILLVGCLINMRFDFTVGLAWRNVDDGNFGDFCFGHDDDGSGNGVIERCLSAPGYDLLGSVESKERKRRIDGAICIVASGADVAEVRLSLPSWRHSEGWNASSQSEATAPVSTILSGCHGTSSVVAPAHSSVFSSWSSATWHPLQSYHRRHFHS